jgi:hypothetical protein
MNMAEVTKAELQQQLTDMTNRAAAAETRVEQLTADLGRAIERADQEAKARQEAAAELEKADTEIGELRKSLKAYKGSATKARGEVTVLRKQISPQARPIGAMKPAKSDEEAAARSATLAAAFAQDTLELVFSDGKREIRELAPLTISGDAWRIMPSQGPDDLGRVLNHEPILEPGDCQREQFDLKGFALINEAGQQVAYRALPDAIRIRRNERFQLPHNTIRF